MRDPLSWSFPVGYLFGITVRVHLLLPIFMIGLVWRAADTKDVIPGTYIDVAMLMGLMFVAILLHELGHCFAARRVDGEANEVLLWPLGGLARCDVPHTPWAHFVTAVGGPAANLVICAACALAMGFLLDASYRPPLHPFHAPFRVNQLGAIELSTWEGVATRTDALGALILARLFWISWVLFLFNTVLIGLPFDAGRVLQAALWPRFGYRQATLYAIFAGFALMVILVVVSIAKNEVLILALAWFTYTSCKMEWFALETGGDDSLFGYDFSQGYTSLEKEDPPAPPRKKKGNFIQRWLQRRATRRMQMEMERQEADERRMDELLDKIQRFGKESLTDEEQRFLKRVSDRYKNKP